MTINSQQYLFQLQETANMASLNYDIWWAYVGEETRPRFVNVMNHYVNYFAISERAHMTTLIVLLYRLLESRKDTYSFKHFFRFSRDNALYEEGEIIDFEKLYKDMEPTAKRVRILRNSVYGHRPIGYTVDEMFKKAALTPNQLKELIEKCKLLVNKMNQALNDSTHAYNLPTREDTIRLLDDLEELRKSGR